MFEDWVDAVVPDAPFLQEVIFAQLPYVEVGGDRFLAGMPARWRTVTLDDVVESGEPPCAGVDGADTEDVNWDDDVLPSASACDHVAGIRTIASEIRAAAGYCGDMEDIGVDADMLAFLEDVDCIGASAFLDHEVEESEDDVVESPGDLPSSGLEAEEEEVSARNCLITLSGVESIEAVQEHLPDFELTPGWEVFEKTRDVRLSVTNCVAGDSLRTLCKTHVSCSLWLKEISGDLHAANCEIFKWAIAGSAMSCAEHKAAGHSVVARWRQRQRLG